MNSSATAEWALFAFGAATALVTVLIAKASSKLFSGKSIKDVVDSANAIIEMYEKHIGALEIEVKGLKTQMAALTSKLDETLQHNVALQNLLMKSPAMNLYPEKP